MSIDPLSSTQPTATATATSPSSGNPLSALTGGDTFLKLLIAQLKYQNPLDPTSGTQFMAQTAQLSEVETLNTLQQQSTQLLTAEQTVEATGLVGRSVTVANPDGTTSTGTVDAVSVDPSGPRLHVAGTTYPLTSLQSVTTA